MNGDLSLSQSLGGLRIANPDESEEVVTVPPSPAAPLDRPPTLSPRSSTDTVTASRSGMLPQLSHEDSVQEEQSLGVLGFDPDTYSLQSSDVSANGSQQSHSPAMFPEDSGSEGLRHRPSLHMGSQQYPSYPSYSQQRSQLNAPNAALRPTSAMYMQPNTSSGSNMSSQGSYRFRDDMGSSDGSVSGMGRSASRAARGVMPGALGREGSRRYRAPGQPANGATSPLPPRKNSKRMRAPTSGSGSGYDGADAPYRGAGPPARSNTEEWQERGAAVGRMQEADASGQQQTRVIKKGVKDFNFGRTLGEGSYSTVLAATDRQTLKEYAIKVLDKRHIIKEKKVKYVNIERDTLNRLTDHPGIVRLYYTFQDERSLYFVLDLATGGELLGVLKKLGSFDMDCTRFYGAEILDSIAYMHTRGVIHRDLKPENVLLDREMHVKITDFGTAKILAQPNVNGGERVQSNVADGSETDRAVSFVGTAEYVSPELLRDKNACKASDLWAFGCIIYQLLAGRPPFKAANEYLTFQKILGLEYTFPDGFPEVARDLVERLLVLEPANRLPVEHIRNHQFFDGMQWGKALWRQKAPRLKPYVAPSAEPIKLNGGTVKNNNGVAAAGAAAALSGTQSAPPLPRPQLRGVTELPPPSQLDIDWSPVLTQNNERILKLGNLIVNSGPRTQSPSGKNGEPSTPSEKPKFSRFFSGTTSKRKERLVLITSSARVIIAAAGGNDKKAKAEFGLLTNGASWKSYVDGKGLTAWCLDTVGAVYHEPTMLKLTCPQRDKHLSFEDPRGTTADPAGTKHSAQEWLESLERARELALAQSLNSSYSGRSMLDHMDSSMSSPSDSIDRDAAMPMPGANLERHNLRQTLRKNTDDDGTFKSRKRFSKRHSKSGLAAVF